MRTAPVFASIAISLLAAACERGKSTEPVRLATADECGALLVIAKEKLKLTGNQTALIHGLGRKDWRPDCDWQTAGINFKDARTTAGYGNMTMIASEITFYRPKFDSDGVIVQYERLTDISEDVFTCRLSRYGTGFVISSCTESFVDPMGTMISADDMRKAIENRYR